MQFRVYVTAVEHGSILVEAKSEDEASQEAERLFNQNQISWQYEEITYISPEEVYT